jgi:nitroreductase
MELLTSTSGTVLAASGRPSVPRRAVAKIVALELAVVVLGLVVVGFFYLAPASGALLRGDSSVMIGDDTDSITNPLQYAVVLDTLKHAPARLLFGAVYSPQLGAPEGEALFIPFIERGFVLLFAPFLDPDLMPTAMVWALMVLTGTSLYGCGRVLGWPRALCFGLAIAFAFTPYTRARGAVHIALVGVYWAPTVIAALHLLARPPAVLAVGSRALVVAAGLLLFAAFAAHYYVIMAVVLAPFFLWFYGYLLPRGARSLGAARRLVLAALPAIAFVGWSALAPVPPGVRPHAANVKSSNDVTEQYLHAYGAHPIDFLTGDVKLGERDVLPWRAELTRAVRGEVTVNRHERTNGIRWSILAALALVPAALAVRRLRRRLDEHERRVAISAVALAVVALLLAVSPQGLRSYDTELGPVQLVARVIPRYRVPSRMGTMVNLAAILATGSLLTAWARGQRRRRAMLSVVPLVMLLDYAPLDPVPLQPIGKSRRELARGEAPCGAGITLPYVSWYSANADFYRVQAELRGTSCRLIHAGYLTDEDVAIEAALGTVPRVVGDLERARGFATCTRASFVIFRLDLPADTRRAFCQAMGWSFVGEDACRRPSLPEEPRSTAACLP